MTVAIVAAVGIALVACLFVRAGEGVSMTLGERRTPDARRAAAMAEAWPVEPRYRVTQEAQRVRAKRTLRRATRLYLAGRKVER